MSYCPKCGFEYKPGINNCPDCGEKLVVELKLVREKEVVREKVITEPKLKLLYITKNMVYANFLSETLEKNEIPCLVRSESGLNLRAGALTRHPVTDIKIYVREENFEKSLKIKELLVDDLQ